MSMSFGSKDGILIRTMTVEDYKQIEGSVYRDEPLTSSATENTNDEKDFSGFHISMIMQGTCLVAINEDDNGRIVGLVLAAVQIPSDLDEQHRKASEMDQCNLKRIVLFVTQAEIKANLYEHYGVAKLLISHMTHVDASMRGKGIGSRLAAALMEVGRSKGFLLIVACCTSFYSARQKEALGMECVYTRAYSDYKNNTGQVVFNPPAPHTHLRIMAMKL